MDLALPGYGLIYDKFKEAAHRLRSCSADLPAAPDCNGAALGINGFANKLLTIKQSVGQKKQEIMEKLAAKIENLNASSNMEALDRSLRARAPSMENMISPYNPFDACLPNRSDAHLELGEKSVNPYNPFEQCFPQSSPLFSGFGSRLPSPKIWATFQDSYHIEIDTDTDSVEIVTEDLLDWECEFLSLLDEYELSREAFVSCLENVILMDVHHPQVDVLVEKWRNEQGLSFEDGEDLLYLTLGKALDFEPVTTCENVLEAAEKHMKVQEAIQGQLKKTGVSQELYDQLETYVWAFCEHKMAPRKVHDLEQCVKEIMEQVVAHAPGVTLDDIFGPAHLLVQIGPHEAIKQLHEGFTRPHEDFYPLENDAKYAKTGRKLCDSHWGPVYSLGNFDSKLVAKVINLSKWERKKAGLDKWNDDCALEILNHRFLTSLNHPNLVKFVAVTMDNRHAYYYQEEGLELFTHVERHRDRYWQQWKRRLLKSPPRTFAEQKSPWEIRATQIFRGIFEGLAFMHSKGIAHRDLKLENMVLVSEGDRLVGKMIDFGVTLRHGDWEKHMLNKGKVGTYPFFSPEACYNSREAYAMNNQIELSNYESYDAAKNDIWTMGHALWGFVMAVLLWEDISSMDNRFTVATKAKFHDNPEIWSHKKLGLRYLAKRYGPQRNCMATDSFIDLLEHILCPEHERYTAAEVLAHPWFNDEQQDSPMDSVSANLLPIQIE